MVGVNSLRALASNFPVVIFPLALRVIFPVPSGEREFIVPPVVSIVLFLLRMVMSPASPLVAFPVLLGMRVKFSLTGFRSLSKPDARSIGPVSIVFSPMMSIFPVSPSLAPEYILAFVVLILLPASRIISPPFPCLSLLPSLGGSDAEIILLFYLMLMLFPAFMLI